MRKLKQWLWYLLTKRMHLNWRLPTNVEVCIRNYSDWCTLNEIFLDTIYDKGLEILFSTSPKSSLDILDLGANVGYFSLRCIHLHRHYQLTEPLFLHLVEGSPETFKELQKRFSTFAPTTESIYLHKGLIGKLTGKGFLKNAKEYNQNTVSLVKDQSGTWMEYLDLNTIHSHPDKIWDFIKCDIEGSEYDFIYNYSNLLRKTRYFVCEFHNFEANPDYQKALHLLKSYGFVEININKMSYGPAIVILFKNSNMSPSENNNF